MTLAWTFNRPANMMKTIIITIIQCIVESRNLMLLLFLLLTRKGIVVHAVVMEVIHPITITIVITVLRIVQGSAIMMISMMMISMIRWLSLSGAYTVGSNGTTPRTPLIVFVARNTTVKSPQCDALV